MVERSPRILASEEKATTDTGQIGSSAKLSRHPVTLVIFFSHQMKLMEVHGSAGLCEVNGGLR